jgi:hypothetical protein
VHIDDADADATLLSDLSVLDYHSFIGRPGFECSAPPAVPCRPLPPFAQ